ncbi:MAG: PKD domain-containing protein, partial [Bacteroidia bacterium]
MKKITLVAMAFFLGLMGLVAQTTSCVDMNAYVNSKNTGGTGFYTLTNGFEEKAAQTYYYSGPGKVSQIRVNGSYPGVGGVPLRVSVYNVDAAGRPTSTLSYADDIFWATDNAIGYITVSLPGGGTTVSNNFAIGIAIRNVFPWGNTFQLKYTGNGEGLGADLASLAGTSTGGNWASAMTSFGKDGDFYLVPKMTNFITSAFTPSTQCATTATTIAFTNTSAMSKDYMFNKIGLAGYAGSNFFYTWDFGDASPVSHLTNPTHVYGTAGSYTVTLTSTLEGWGGTCTNVKTMTISVGLSVSSSAITNVTCNGGNNGSVTAVSNGGTAPFTYSLNGTTYQSSATFNSLTAGAYTLYIKDAVGCTNTAAFTITQPAAISFTTAASTNASCGNNDGSILAAATGGTGAIQYQLNSGVFQSSGSFTGLAAGSYTVTAKDANGCTKPTNIIVNNLGAPVLTVTSTTNVSCHGGNDATIILSATGGVGTHLFSVNGGATFQTSGSFTGLIAGTYPVLVKDASGCTQGVTLIISEPSSITFSTSQVTTSCHGVNDGQINVSSVIGGIGTFAYSLDGINYQSSPNFSELNAGTYTVYVKDAASCVAQTTVVVNQPVAVTATFALTGAGCNGSDNGSIIVSATGGTQQYNYSINDQEPQPSSQFGDLTAGTYTITVTDKNGCSYSSTAVITQPTAVTGTSTITNSTCSNSNGGILVVAAGGSGSGYQYSLDGVVFNTTGSFTGLPAGNYFITVKDGTGCQTVVPATIFDSNGPVITSSSHTNVGCNGGNDGSITVNTVTGGTGALLYSINAISWQSSTSFSGLTAGTYTVYVKDINGCIGTVEISITEPSAFVITNSIVNVSCHGSNSGSVSVFAAGGAGTLAYSIDNGATYQSSNTFTNLYAGSYKVIVRDIAGCTGFILFNITEPSVINFFAGVLNVNCHGNSNGAINVYAHGGTGAYQYSLTGSTYQASNSFTGLFGGAYTVYVKDANGCVVMQTVTVVEPAALSISSVVSNVTCSGGNNGVVDLTINGGVGHNNFSWSNGAGTEDIFGLVAGTYSVIVTDGNGCNITGSYTITQPLSPIVVNAVVTGTSGSTGAINATITGGTSPYTFSWSNGATTEDITNLTPGVYTITVTDALGCVS